MLEKEINKLKKLMERKNLGFLSNEMLLPDLLEKVGGSISPYVTYRMKGEKPLSEKAQEGYNSKYQLEQAERIFYNCISRQFDPEFRKYKAPETTRTVILEATEIVGDNLVRSEMNRLLGLYEDMLDFLKLYLDFNYKIDIADLIKPAEIKAKRWEDLKKVYYPQIDYEQLEERIKPIPRRDDKILTTFGKTQWASGQMMRVDEEVYLGLSTIIIHKYFLYFFRNLKGKGLVALSKKDSLPFLTEWHPYRSKDEDAELRDLMQEADKLLRYYGANDFANMIRSVSDPEKFENRLIYYYIEQISRLMKAVNKHITNEMTLLTPREDICFEEGPDGLELELELLDTEGERKRFRCRCITAEGPIVRFHYRYIATFKKVEVPVEVPADEEQSENLIEEEHVEK